MRKLIIRFGIFFIPVATLSEVEGLLHYERSSTSLRLTVLSFSRHEFTNSHEFYSEKHIVCHFDEGEITLEIP